MIRILAGAFLLLAFGPVILVAGSFLGAALIALFLAWLARGR